MKKYLVYKIINILNKMIYIGSHSTDNINDSYMGSGTKLNEAIKENGLENFEKIILYQFNNKEDMLKKEKELVNREFIKRSDTYNVILGGGWNTSDTAIVKDKNDKCFRVHIEDPRYLSGELISIAKGKVSVKDTAGIFYSVDKNDPRYLSGELKHNMKEMIIAVNKKNKVIIIHKNDPRYLSGELIPISKGKITVKDKENKTYQVNINDPKYLSGELRPFFANKKHKEESKRKIGLTNSIKQSGEKNSQFGTCWITNLDLKKNKKIQTKEISKWLYLGWIRGRKQKW